MSNIPNVGDTVATADGRGGAAWGLRENAEGVFVQFSAGDDWHPVAPETAPPPEPDPVAETAESATVAKAAAATKKPATLPPVPTA